MGLLLLISILLFCILFRKKLEENKENTDSMGFSPETLFKTVEGKPQGQKTKDAQHKFKIDQAFIQKVLEFETSSPLLRNAMFSYNSKLLTLNSQDG